MFRFPGGLINSGINPLLAKHNLVAVDWSVDSLDWKLKDKDKITDRVLSKVEDGDVVLLHDIHLETIEALEQILSNLKAQGYEFVTVSELFAIYNVTPTFGKLYFHDVESKNNIYSYINSQKANKDDYELILLMGCDVSSDINYYTTKPTEQQKCMRSDTMVIACINKKTKRVKLISLLRDIYVDIPGFGKDKLNAAIVYGGPMLALQTINKNFNLDIKKYIVINMESFVKTVDRLGGIDVELTKQEAIYINAMVEEAKYQLVPVFRVYQASTMVKFHLGCNTRLVHHHHSISAWDDCLDSTWNGNMTTRSYTYAHWSMFPTNCLITRNELN